MRHWSRSLLIDLLIIGNGAEALLLPLANLVRRLRLASITIFILGLALVDIVVAAIESSIEAHRLRKFLIGRVYHLLLL